MDRYDLLAIGGGAAEYQRLTGATAGRTPCSWTWGH